MGENPLERFVLGPAFGVFDRDWRETESREIVWAGAHVRLANLAGQLEAIRNQGGGGEWDQFGSPFVEVHVRVEAAALLQIGRGGTLGLEPIERPGVRGEETKGVVMGAAKRLRLDESSQPGGRKTKRPLGVPDGLGSINHRPFVQPVAAKPRGARLRGLQHAQEPSEGGKPAGLDAPDRGGHPGAVVLIAGPGKELFAAGPRNGNPEPRMPAPELPGAEAVVTEEKIVHRVRFTAGEALEVRLDPGGNARLVRLDDSPPLRRI